jgi:predicted MFS family arabinose efflux permease
VNDADAQQSATAREWRSGWLPVAVTTLAVAVGPTVLPHYTLGVFVGPFERSFGWSRSEIQAAILFSTGVSALTAPLVGEFVHRAGVRIAALLGLIGLGLAFALASLIGGQVWHLYAVYCLMALAGATAGPIAWTYLISSAFVASRGLALGIALSGTGLCAASLPQVTAMIVVEWGWRAAYLGLAGLILLIVLPAAALTLPRGRVSDVPAGQRPGPAASLSSVVRLPRFWLLSTSVTCVYLAVAGASANLIPSLTDLGLTVGEAASALSVFGLSIIFGRVLVGLLIDRFWAPAVASIFMVLAAAGSLAFTFDLHVAGYALASAMLGMATGMELDMLAFLTARYFGMDNYARYYSLLWISVSVSGAIAPFMYAMIFDTTGSYVVAFYLASGLLLLSAVLILMLGPYPEPEPCERY